MQVLVYIFFRDKRNVTKIKVMCFFNNRNRFIWYDADNVAVILSESYLGYHFVDDVSSAAAQTPECVSFPYETLDPVLCGEPWMRFLWGLRKRFCVNCEKYKTSRKGCLKHPWQ